MNISPQFSVGFGYHQRSDHAISLCPRGRGTPLAGAARTPKVAGRLRTQRPCPLPQFNAQRRPYHTDFLPVAT
jgi:hypothetical protein